MALTVGCQTAYCVCVYKHCVFFRSYVFKACGEGDINTKSGESKHRENALGIAND